MPHRKPQDLTGNQFGRLTVVRSEGKGNYGKYLWLCRCSCGNTIISSTSQLNNGNTRSCGCLKREMVVNKNKIHGMAHTPIYNVWSAMKNRCLNPNDKQYKDYGGKGVKICDKWLTFEGFYEDIGSTYAKGLTIERKDYNGDYCPENCIWTDRFTQANNTSRNRYETVNGITDSLANLCRRFGFTYATIQHRLQRGWSIEEAFNTPRLRNPKK
jgi:hypothetical protein